MQVQVDAIHVGGKWLECGSRQRISFWVSKQRSDGSHLYLYNKVHGKQRWFALSPSGDSKHYRHTALTHGDLITIFYFLINFGCACSMTHRQRARREHVTHPIMCQCIQMRLVLGYKLLGRILSARNRGHHHMWLSANARDGPAGGCLTLDNSILSKTNWKKRPKTNKANK